MLGAGLGKDIVMERRLLQKFCIVCSSRYILQKKTSHTLTNTTISTRLFNNIKNTYLNLFQTLTINFTIKFQTPLEDRIRREIDLTRKNSLFQKEGSNDTSFIPKHSLYLIPPWESILRETRFFNLRIAYIIDVIWQAASEKQSVLKAQ